MMSYVKSFFNGNSESKIVSKVTQKEKNSQSYASKILFTVLKISTVSLGVGTIILLAFRGAGNKFRNNNGVSEIERFNDNSNPLPFDVNEFDNYENVEEKSENRRSVKEYIQGSSEFQVNTYTTSNQGYPSVSSLNDGGFVVVWQSDGQDGSGYGIYGQCYNIRGLLVANEFRVNTYTVFDQGYSSPSYPKSFSVSNLSDGGFVVVWQSDGQDGNGFGIYGQRYNATCHTVDNEFQINTYTINDQGYPSVAGLNDGGFVVVWMSNEQDGSSYGVYGQRYNSSGTTLNSEFQVNTYAGNDQGAPSITGLNNGGFVVVWNSPHQDGSSYGIYGQGYNVGGIKVGGEFQVNTYTIGFQIWPSVTGLDDGSFVVTCISADQDGDSDGIYGQRYNSGGIKVGGEFQINTYTISSQSYSSVASLGANGFVVTWISVDQDGDGWEVYGQRYNATCHIVGDEFQVNIYTTGDQLYPSISSLKNGGFVVVWASNGQDGDAGGIYGRISVPSVVNNQLNITEGATAVLTSDMLLADSWWAEDSRLEFTVDNIQHGYFERVSNLGIPITSFTQQEIVDGNIRFIHDGGEDVPSYEIKVTDGELETSYQPASIIFTNKNDAPQLINNKLVIDRGETLLITNKFLFATDPDNNNSTLTFTVRNMIYGHFENINNPGSIITTFTQQDINDNQIQFVHDDGQYMPYYETKVSDGELETSFYQANVTFNDDINDVPMLINNKLVINKGEAVVLDNDMLSATDSDNDDNLLIFTTNNVQYGLFTNVTNPVTEITTFIQQKITNSEIQFVHDNSKNAPSYEIKVSDSKLETVWDSASITFDNTEIPARFPYEYIIIGGVVVGVCITATACILSIAGIGAYIALKNKQKNNDEVELLEKSATSFDVGDFLVNYKVNHKDIEVLKHIGSGSEATVYKAKWNDQIVAYKVFKGINQDDIKGFEKEAKIMLESNYPNIVRLYRICIKQESFGMLMEFMELGSLKTVLAEKAIDFTWQSKWNIAYDVASALKFLHSKKVFHRDIKTDNVLLYENKDGFHAKLADFGLSKVQKAGEQSATMGIGTFKYMAPEMVLGSGKLSIEKTDIYALGMVYVALANEKEPYAGQLSAMNMPAQVGRGELWQKIDQTKCPSTFFNLTNCCRDAEPEKRPSAEKIVEELNGMKEQVVDFKLF